MQPNQQLTTEDGTVLDPKVLKVMRTIRQIESGGDYGVVGDAGAARGAFQYNEKTGPGWKNIARQYLGDENAPMDKANQNKATYYRIKEWKDKDFQPEEIAALWNGASKGSNGRYTCNNPDYCRKFREVLTAGQQAAPIGATQFQTSVPRPEDEGVLSQLGTAPYQAPQEPSKMDTRLAQGSEALGKLSTGVAEGDVSDIASGTLQTAGALAGGVVDATDAALGLIPGYNAAMDFVGKKVIAPALGAVGGEKVYKQWQEFSQTNPDAAKNIASIGNIVSVIPIFKAARTGMGLVGDAAKAGAAKTGFVKSVEDAAKTELRASGASAPSKAGQVLTARNIKGKTVDPVDTIVDGDYLPDVIEDAQGIPRYNSQAAIRRLDDSLEVDEQNLQGMLEDASRQGLVGYVPMTYLRTQTDDLIRKSFADRGQVDAAMRKANKIFDDFTKYKGDMVPLTELNNMKRGIREAVNFNSPKLGADVRYQMGNLFMDKIEEVAEKQGIKTVAEVNADMASKIRAKEALEFLDQRSVQERPGFRSMLGRRSGDVGTIVGEAGGQALGIPGAGALLGRTISNRAISGSGKSVVGKLKSKRTRKPLTKLQTGAALAPLLGQRLQEDQSEQK